MINKWIMKETNLMKRSLEKWVRAPIILGGASTHLFGGSSTHYFKRAWAPIIQKGTSTHYSKTTKQRTSEQMQNGHERNKVPEVLFWKNEGAHPLFLGGASTHLFGARAPIISRGHEQSLFKEQPNRKQMNGHNERERNKVHEMLSWKNEGAHPLF